MANLLLIETASDVCSAAIAVDGQIAALAEQQDAQNHASLLTPFIEACCRQAGMSMRDLHGVAVSSGPGSYTALRVGASTAKGICFALNLPLIAVDTLKALARASWQAFPNREKWTGKDVWLIPMLDARRQEVWTAVYTPDLEPLAPAQPQIIQNNLFINNLAPERKYEFALLSGNGAFKAGNVQDFEGTVGVGKEKLSAANLATLAEQKFEGKDFENITYFEPFYMKPPNITVPGSGKFLTEK